MNTIPPPSTATSDTSERKAWTHSLLDALKLWGVWRLGLSLWGLILWRAGLILPGAGQRWLHGLRPAVEGARAALIDIWLRWDTVQYLRIIQSGYGPDDRSAYFPLYPQLGKIFGAPFGGDGLLGLLLVSNLAAIGCFLMLDQLARATGMSTDHLRIPVATVFYPAAFFLLVAYPHSLLLLLILAAALAQRQGRMTLTFICGLMAGLTHATGLALAALLLVNTWRMRERRLTGFLGALGPVFGMAAFLGWRAWVGYPPIGELIGEVWGRSIGVIMELQGVLTARIWLLRGWPNVLVLGLGLGAAFWSYRRHRYGWAVMQAVVLLIPILSAPGFEPLAGLARYAVIGFPTYFALAHWLPPGRARRLALVPAAGVNLFLCGLFLLWGFVG
jgi:hypothetical protein